MLCQHLWAENAQPVAADRSAPSVWLQYKCAALISDTSGTWRNLTAKVTTFRIYEVKNITK